jgi:hypothetical protein
VKVIVPRWISAMRPATLAAKSPVSPIPPTTAISPSASPGAALISGSGVRVFASGAVSSRVVLIGL